MSWNANDLEHLTLIDRVKRLERSTLKPNEDGGYDETSPNLTERVDALEIKFGAKYGYGDTLPTPEVGTSHTYLVVGNGVATDEGALQLLIDGKIVYDGVIINGSTIIVSNFEETLFVTNGMTNNLVANLTITVADYLSLMRIN